MYINELNYRNVGPISQLDFVFRRNAEGVPVPTVFVGKNGSGKSILLSNIVDAFYEIANIEYKNVTPSWGLGHQYYKTISDTQIQIGQSYMTAFLRLQQEDEKVEYVYKMGEVSFEDFKSTIHGEPNKSLDWNDTDAYKKVWVKEKIVPDIFDKNIVCYFGPNRYMKPEWMGEKYYNTEDIGTYSVESRQHAILKNSITVENMPELTLQWLCDVITDSRGDLVKTEDSYSVEYPKTDMIDSLSITRKNTERIMSIILGEDVVFRMRNRSAGRHRFAIFSLDGREVVPSLDSLSTGQFALFNLFATIIRYADNDNIELSYRLPEIEGIVIVDEIELHLHTELQRKVLPNLIALFPKVQFIITSHSPLFLLGMREQFGEENFDIYEMPSGRKIPVEQFSEFENAYQYLSETNKYQAEIASEIDKRKGKPLIITEGSTDWKHIKAAYQALQSDPGCPNWLATLTFEFLEYESDDKAEGAVILQMGNKKLENVCEQHSYVPQTRKLIFIADRDVSNTVKKLGGEGPYRNWGNHVYSLCLPVPEHRTQTPEICIEHLYLDDQLKYKVTFENGIERRIFLGNEFSETGISIDGKGYICTDQHRCGPKSNHIIDGTKDRRVCNIQDDGNNYALSKTCFATYVLEKKAPFDKMDFSGFIPLFEIIRDILAEPNEEV